MADMTNPKNRKPMSRLVQGDVGSVKQLSLLLYVILSSKMACEQH
ncbi:MAG: hypothetical protein ACLR13_07545 [Acutalibacteraceae bacterium]